jgi:Family of unknown function (DUF6364)
METTKLTVRLPKDDLDFAKRYAREHGLTVTELIDRYLRALQASPRSGIHPEVERISGLVPADMDAEEEYAEHVLGKHR